MTSRGRQLAGIFAICIAFFLPKHVDCGFPGGDCTKAGILHQLCTSYEVEPIGFWLIEKLVERDVGFAYTSGERCR